jgi:hypothetical protein
MNVEVIRSVVMNIEPRELDMGVFLATGPRGTVACLAGSCARQHIGEWTANLYSRPLGVENFATGKMELTHEQAERLFFTARWPSQFARFDSELDWCIIDESGKQLTPGTPEYLARVRERVEVFINSGGEE